MPTPYIYSLILSVSKAAKIIQSKAVIFSFYLCCFININNNRQSDNLI